MRALTTAFALAAFCAAAADAAENSRLVIRATGQFETADTAVYTVFLASRDQALGELVISSAVPPGTRFLENLDIPAGVRYEGVARNVIQWSVAALDRDTLLGPFTFRVKIDKADPTTPYRQRRDPFSVDTPAVQEFSVSYRLPVPEVLIDSGVAATLLPLADSGSITFDQSGTIDSSSRNGLATVGGTGILVYVPQGAVDRKVTLSFRRLTVEDGEVPQDAKDTWWCARYQVSLEPPVTFAKAISYALPARRAIPSGLTVHAFSSVDSKNWKETASTTAGTAFYGQLRSEPPAGFGSGGNCVTMPFGFITCTTNAFCSGFGGCPLGGGGFGAFGLNQADRAKGSSTATVLTQQFAQPFKPAQITDGTSNIIAILIGIR